jgi:5-methylcytosine-specific restriction endonuclease McrA
MTAALHEALDAGADYVTAFRGAALPVSHPAAWRIAVQQQSGDRPVLGYWCDAHLPADSRPGPDAREQATGKSGMIPAGTRAGVMARAGGCCEGCGENWDATTRPTLHHLRYWTGPDRDMDQEPIFGRETPDDLDALCWDCHQGRHRDMNGTYWRDPENMEEQWAPYRWARDKDD